MKKLLLLALAAGALALAGCSGMNVDAVAVTDCMVQCLDQKIQVTLPDGQVIWVTPSDFEKAVWDSDKQTLQLKGYKAGKLTVGGK